MNTFEPPIFEYSGKGKIGAGLPELDVPEAELPADLLRDDELAGVPELSETEVTRHFTRISQRNYCIDTGMYPLGSCTMKYNPKVHEEAARLPGFAAAHPLQAAEQSQGALRLMYELQGFLAELAGFDQVSLQPAAGAQGEFTGILVFRAYHREQGDDERVEILCPTRPTVPTPPPPRWSACGLWKSRPTAAATSTSATSRPSSGRAPPA